MITLIVVLIVLGLALYVIETYLPVSPPIKLIIRIVVIIVSILLILRFFGISDASFKI